MINKNIYFFLIIVIIFGLFFRVISLNNDFTCEETDFISPAEAIKYTGRPVFYHSESQPVETALWHPPMYIFLMAFIFKFFTGEIAARSINIFFSIFTAILIFLFCSNILGKEKGRIIGLIASAFFMINYSVLSSSILIDIDVLSMFFVFCFIYSILRNYQTKKRHFLLIAGMSMFFGLANRYPMMILIYLGIGLYYYLNRELKERFKEYFYVGIISSICFIIVWGIYSIFIEPGNFFSFLFHNVKFGTSQVSNLKIYLGSFILNISQFIRLFTLPATILMIWSFIYFFKKKSKLTKILLIYILPTLILFTLVPRPAFGYPRYFMTIFPGIFILIGIFIFLHLKDFRIPKREKIIIFLSLVVSLSLLIILNPQGTFYESNGLIKATNLPDFVFNLIASLPLLFVYFSKENKKKILICILIALFFSYSFYFNIKLITNDSHIKETGKYLQNMTSEEEIIIVPKAIGYYSQRRFYVNENTKPKLDFSPNYLKEYFINSAQNPEMDDEFFWPEGLYSGFYSGEYSGVYSDIPSKEELEKTSYVVLYHPVSGFEPDKKIGEFYVYNLKQLNI